MDMKMKRKQFELIITNIDRAIPNVYKRIMKKKKKYNFTKFTNQ